MSCNIIVAICTYERNIELENLLTKLEEFSKSYWGHLNIGLTVVDDSQNGGASHIAQKFKDTFSLGLVYANSASRNISKARNIALENSIGRADWIAMTDDDCEPSEHWLSELERVQRATDADVVTGLMLRRASDNAPNWIKTQPFLNLGEFDAADGAPLAVAFTNNCLISSSLLVDSGLRFDLALGRIGGEDMAFFHGLHRYGARINFAKKAFVYENEPPQRLTLRYQLLRYFWHGNSSVVTSLRSGKGRGRLLVHGMATCGRAVALPVQRMSAFKSPQFAYSLAYLCEGAGKLCGVFGIKINHH